MEQVFHFSAPGRVELGGNHTDHQHGCVLAAAVDLETSADVRLTGGGSIRVLSEGYAPVEIPLRDLAPRPEECGTTAALVRGVAAAFAARGAALGGLEVHVRSDVAPGSGLSSSAAQILQVFLQFAAANHLAFLTLEVRPSNAAAIALYQGFGFEEVGRRKNYYDLPKEDALILTKYFETGEAEQQ